MNWPLLISIPLYLFAGIYELLWGRTWIGIMLLSWSVGNTALVLDSTG